MKELLHQRILGAVEFVDAITLQPLPRPLKVTSDEITFRRNRSGRYVVINATDVKDEYLSAFPDATAAPSPGSITRSARVEDPAGEYLPRQFALALPRNPDPKNIAAADSIFRAVAVSLFPTPARAAQPNWSVVRVRARSSVGTKPLIAGAIARVKRDADPKVEAYAITDAHGEAMLAVPNIPFFLTNPSGTEVIGKDLDAELIVFVEKTGKTVLPEDLKADESRFFASAPVALKLAAATTLTPDDVEVTVS
jgi:hypothetical protein